MKKKVFIVLLILAVFMLFGAFPTTYALDTATDDTGRSTYTATSHEEKLVGDVTTYVLENGTEQYNGNTSSFRVHMLQQLCNEDAKVVTWAMQSDSEYVRGNVGQIAADYEETHPGWKVIGGINADQYTTLQGDAAASGHDPFSPQPYYSMICDYERLFAINWYGTASNLVAFTNDGSNDQLLRLNTGSKDQVLAGFYAYVYDNEGNFEAKYPIEKLNEDPGSGEASVFASFYVRPQSLYRLNGQQVTGENVFIVTDAELAYVSNIKTYGTYFSGKAGRSEDAFFGKGEISQVNTDTTLLKGQFAIKSNNTELTSALAIGKKVVVQYDYNQANEAFNNVESGVGYHLVQRDNNVDSAIAGSYNTNRYTRSVVGRKADGTVVLMSIDSEKGRNADTTTSLASAYGVNAVCKANGIVEAYQMDGGGSVQMYVREGDSFVPVTQSRDYGPGETTQRSIYNALLFVVRSIDVATTVNALTTESATINFEDRMTHGKTIDKYIVEIGSERFETGTKELVLNDLSSNTEYKYNLYVQSGDVEYKVSEQLAFTTLKKEPIINDILFDIDGENMTITFDITDPDAAITDYFVQVAGFGCKKNGLVFTTKRFTSEAEVFIQVMYRVLSTGETYKVTIVNPHYKSIKGYEVITDKMTSTLEDIFK